MRVESAAIKASLGFAGISGGKSSLPLRCELLRLSLCCEFSESMGSSSRSQWKRTYSQSSIVAKKWIQLINRDICHGILIPSTGQPLLLHEWTRQQWILVLREFSKRFAKSFRDWNRDISYQFILRPWQCDFDLQNITPLKPAYVTADFLVTGGRFHTSAIEG